MCTYFSLNLIYSQAIQSIFPFLLVVLPLFEGYVSIETLQVLLSQLIHLYLTILSDRCVVLSMLFHCRKILHNAL